MPRWPLTRFQSRARTQYCPMCKIAVGDVREHFRTKRHDQKIEEKGDIFWIQGSNEAFYGGRHYKPEGHF